MPSRSLCVNAFLHSDLRANQVPPVPKWHRWRCPLCGASFRHPWYLADHLRRPSTLGMPHELDEQDAWTLAATVEPVDMSPGLSRYPTLPVIPMAAPPSQKAVAHG